MARFYAFWTKAKWNTHLQYPWNSTIKPSLPCLWPLWPLGQSLADAYSAESNSRHLWITAGPELVSWLQSWMFPRSLVGSMDEVIHNGDSPDGGLT